MPMNRFALFIVFILFAVSSFGQPVGVKISDKKITENGKVFYLHSVVQGQTLFSISRAYEVSISDILTYNPLARLGYRAIIVEGQPSDPERRWLLTITKEGAALNLWIPMATPFPTPAMTTRTATA